MYETTLVLAGLVIALLIGLLISFSAFDYQGEIIDQNGCIVREHIDNRIGLGNSTRTVQAYCPEE